MTQNQDAFQVGDEVEFFVRGKVTVILKKGAYVVCVTLNQPIHFDNEDSLDLSFTEDGRNHVMDKNIRLRIVARPASIHSESPEGST